MRSLLPVSTTAAGWLGVLPIYVSGNLAPGSIFDGILMEFLARVVSHHPDKGFNLTLGGIYSQLYLLERFCCLGRRMGHKCGGVLVR
jgi:hypothetical protein